MTSQPSSTLRSAMGARGPMRPGVIEKAKDPRGAASRLLGYLLPFKVELAIVLTGVLVYTMLGLAGPYLLGLAIDRYVATRRAAGLAHIALLMLAAYIL